jgi:hypothetical protein
MSNLLSDVSKLKENFTKTVALLAPSLTKQKNKESKVT